MVKKDAQTLHHEAHQPLQKSELIDSHFGFTDGDGNKVDVWFKQVGDEPLEFTEIHVNDQSVPFHALEELPDGKQASWMHDIMEHLRTDYPMANLSALR